MNYLIDTQVLLWFLSGDPRLPEEVIRFMESEENQGYLSDASLWEISIKYSLGKLKLAEPFDELLIERIHGNGFRLLALTRGHLFGVARLPFHHRDPFDRLLVAVGRAEKLAFLTLDPAFRKYDLEFVSIGEKEPKRD